MLKSLRHEGAAGALTLRTAFDRAGGTSGREELFRP